MLQAFVLFAQEAPKEGAGDIFKMLAPIGLILVVFYFLLILPQKREKRNRQELLSKLKKNDKVLTNAGIIGVVHTIDEKDQEVVLKLDEGRMKVLRSTIVQILTPKDQPKETDSPAIKQ